MRRRRGPPPPPRGRPRGTDARCAPPGAPAGLPEGRWRMMLVAESHLATRRPPAGANEFAAGKSQSPPSRTRRPGYLRHPKHLRVRNRANHRIRSAMNTIRCDNHTSAAFGDWKVGAGACHVVGIVVQPPPAVWGRWASNASPEGACPPLSPLAEARSNSPLSARNERGGAGGGAPRRRSPDCPKRDRILPFLPLRGGEGPGERGPGRAPVRSPSPILDRCSSPP